MSRTCGMFLVLAVLGGLPARSEESPRPPAQPQAPQPKKERGWMGVLLGDSIDGGVGIAALVPGGPAASAGLKPGDVILEVNGRAVPSEHELGDVVAALGPGQTLDLALLRKGQVVRASVVLGRRSDVQRVPAITAPPAPPVPPVAPSAARPRAVGALGVELADVTPALRKHYGAPEDAGVLVVRIDPQAPAARAGVAVGDIVVALGGQAIRNVAEVEECVVVRAQEPLTARLVRDGEMRELLVRVAPVTPAPRAAAGSDRERLKRALHAELAALERRIEELRRKLAELEGQR